MVKQTINQKIEEIKEEIEKLEEAKLIGEFYIVKHSYGTEKIIGSTYLERLLKFKVTLQTKIEDKQRIEEILKMIDDKIEDITIEADKHYKDTKGYEGMTDEEDAQIDVLKELKLKIVNEVLGE